MTAQKANLMLLKIGDGESPEQFITLGGLRGNRMSINRQPVAAPDVTSGQWRKALSGGGIASVRVQGNGLFLNSAAEERLRQKALAGDAAMYQLYFGNGDRMEAAYVVTQYERSGTAGELEGFAITLESAGAVNYISAG